MARLLPAHAPHPVVLQWDGQRITASGVGVLYATGGDVDAELRARRLGDLWAGANPEPPKSGGPGGIFLRHLDISDAHLLKLSGDPSGGLGPGLNPTYRAQ